MGESSDVQLIVIDKWNKLFKGTKYKPIDIHTALCIKSLILSTSLSNVLNSLFISPSNNSTNVLQRFR